jgi:hypothetical protein
MVTAAVRDDTSVAADVREDSKKMPQPQSDYPVHIEDSQIFYCSTFEKSTWDKPYIYMAKG